MLKASNQSIWMGKLAFGVALLGACDPPPVTEPDTPSATVETVGQLGEFAELGGKADGHVLPQFDPSFPATQDLAVLLPMDVDPPILGELPTQFDRKLLAREWVDEVSAAFGPTDIGPGFTSENNYEDWQLVSMRIAPCGPLGSFPGELPAGVCWPQVRLVWQPVMEDHHNGWMYVDTYGDDRAIHALYRVHSTDGREGIDPALQMMQEILASPEGFMSINPTQLQDFYHARDRALLRLSREVYALRGDLNLQDEWSQMNPRAETYHFPELSPTFQGRLYSFLQDFADPYAMHELTAFSLPEGRSPFSADIWVFLAFDVHFGQLFQRDIRVQSREDGRELIHLGMDQTVSAATEDPELIEALEVDPTLKDSLRDHVILDSDDEIRLAEVLADPRQTFVQNTTCASCHRLTDLPFDFHTFSYLEDRSATISPRVVEDTKHDLELMRGFIANLSQP